MAWSWSRRTMRRSGLDVHAVIEAVEGYQRPLRRCATGPGRIFVQRKDLLVDVTCTATPVADPAFRARRSTSPAGAAARPARPRPGPPRGRRRTPRRPRSGAGSPGWPRPPGHPSSARPKDPYPDRPHPGRPTPPAHRAAGTARARCAVPPEHPAQQPAVQRAPRDDPDAVSLAGGQHLQLDRARREVVQGLLADQPEHRAAGGSLLGLGDVPAREVRRAHVNDLAWVRGRSSPARSRPTACCGPRGASGTGRCGRSPAGAATPHRPCGY